MTVDETKKILAIIKVAFPASYKDIDKETAWATVQLWAKAFKDVPFTMMERAVSKYIAKGRFAPSIAEINEELSTIHCNLISEAAVCKSLGDKQGVKKMLDAALSVDIALRIGGTRVEALQ